MADEELPGLVVRDGRNTNAGDEEDDEEEAEKEMKKKFTWEKKEELGETGIHGLSTLCRYMVAYEFSLFLSLIFFRSSQNLYIVTFC